MKFTVNRKMLLDAYQFVKPFVASKAANPAMTSVLVIADENGVLSLRGTNMATEARYSLKAKVAEVGETCLSGLPFQVLKQLSQNEVTLTVKDGQLSFGKHTFVVVDPDHFPEKKIAPAYEKMDTTRILNALAAAKIGLSSGGADEAEKCYWFSQEDSAIATSNGFQIVWYDGIDFPGETCLLNQSVMALVYRAMHRGAIGLECFFGAMSGIRSTGVEDWEIIFTETDAMFPDAAGLVKDARAEEPAVVLMLDRDAVLKVVKLCRTYAKAAAGISQPRYFTLQVNEKKVVISMDVATIAGMTETLKPISIDGATEDTFCIDPGRFIQALSVVGTDHIRMTLFNAEAPFVVENPDNGSFYYLQMTDEPVV